MESLIFDITEELTRYSNELPDTLSRRLIGRFDTLNQALNTLCVLMYNGVSQPLVNGWFCNVVLPHFISDESIEYNNEIEHILMQKLFNVQTSSYTQPLPGEVEEMILVYVPFRCEKVDPPIGVPVCPYDEPPYIAFYMVNGLISFYEDEVNLVRAGSEVTIEILAQNPGSVGVTNFVVTRLEGFEPTEYLPESDHYLTNLVVKQDPTVGRILIEVKASNCFGESIVQYEKRILDEYAYHDADVSLTDIPFTGHVTTCTFDETGSPTYIAYSSTPMYRIDTDLFISTRTQWYYKRCGEENYHHVDDTFASYIDNIILNETNDEIQIFFKKECSAFGLYDIKSEYHYTDSDGIAYYVPYHKTVQIGDFLPYVAPYLYDTNEFRWTPVASAYTNEYLLDPMNPNYSTDVIEINLDGVDRIVTEQRFKLWVGADNMPFRAYLRAPDYAQNCTNLLVQSVYDWFGGKAINGFYINGDLIVPQMTVYYSNNGYVDAMSRPPLPPIQGTLIDYQWGEDWDEDSFYVIEIIMPCEVKMFHCVYTRKYPIEELEVISGAHRRTALPPSLYNIQDEVSNLTAFYNVLATSSIDGVVTQPSDLSIGTHEIIVVAEHAFGSRPRLEATSSVTIYDYEYNVTIPEVSYNYFDVIPVENLISYNGFNDYPLFSLSSSLDGVISVGNNFIPSNSLSIGEHVLTFSTVYNGETFYDTINLSIVGDIQALTPLYNQGVSGQDCINLATATAVAAGQRHDPDGITWLTPTQWDAAIWDGVGKDLYETDWVVLKNWMFPNINTMRGLRQLYYSINPFADLLNPTVAEIENWHIEVIRLFRRLLGSNNDELPISNSRRLYLACQFSDERKYTNVWDVKYPGTLDSAYGRCIGGSNPHCGATFVPDAVDQIPYLKPGELPISYMPGGAEGVFSVNTNIPWCIKLARVLGTSIAIDSFTAHTGPFIGREFVGISFRCDGSNSNVRIKWSGNSADVPVVYNTPNRFRLFNNLNSKYFGVLAGTQYFIYTPQPEPNNHSEYYLEKVSDPTYSGFVFEDIVYVVKHSVYGHMIRFGDILLNADTSPLHLQIRITNGYVNGVSRRINFGDAIKFYAPDYSQYIQFPEPPTGVDFGLTGTEYIFTDLN